MTNERKYIDEDTYLIEHEKRNAAGEVIGTFMIQYETNETATEIRLTDKVIKQIARECGGSSYANYKGYEKKVVYKGIPVASLSVDPYEDYEDRVVAKLVYKNGKTVEFIVNKD